MRKSPSTPRADAHKWEFKPRFRRHAFGWKSQPAITRIKQAVAEIKKVAKKEPALAAEGAIVFLERVSPSLEHVDGSSGSIGNPPTLRSGSLGCWKTTSGASPSC